MRYFDAVPDRRGAVAPLLALALPALLGAGGLAVDAGFYYVEQQRLQLAADAAAMATALLLPAHPTTVQLQSAALQAAQDATGGGVIGTLATPIAVSGTGTAVTVTLSSTTQGFFSRVLSAAAPKLGASATAGMRAAAACVLALNSSQGEAIDVNNMGSITATGCGIFANSSSNSAIHLDSGTISGQSVGMVGGMDLSNSGSNTLSPNPPTTGAAARSDPYAALSAPTPGSCGYNDGNFTAWQSTPYHFTQSRNVFCGNTPIGGNGTSDQFDPGIYYVVNGDLVFDNAAITSATGVTFVLTGSAPGGFKWTNYSNTPTTMTAPTSGATAGMLVWQTCSAGGDGESTMNGGSTLQISGAFYVPCGEMQMNNNAQLTAAPGADMTVVADTISVVGSAGIAAAGGNGSSSASVQAVLQQ